MPNIQHGNLGQVEYLTEEQNWRLFRRSPNVQKIIGLGEPTSLSHLPLENSVEASRRDNRRKTLTRDISQKHRELLPAVNHIINSYDEAAAIEYISQWGGSKTGPFITVAYATSFENLLGGSHPLHKILVCAIGVGGSKLGVMNISTQKFKGVNMTMRRPGFRSQSKPVFSCDGPVEQIEALFESPNGKSKPYLVVRTQKSITMLQIMFRSGLSGGETEYTASTVSSVSSRMNGGQNFLHFAMNPWQTGQIAVIDSNGRWCLWKFTMRNNHRSGLVLPSPTQGASGMIEHSGINLHWAKIVWGACENKLIIATRKQLLDVDLETGSILDLFETTIKNTAKDVEIIDLIRPPGGIDYIIALTNYTMNLLMLESDVKSATIWRHCRHPEDKSLSCAVWAPDKEKWFFLFSRHNPNITVLRISSEHDFFDLFLIDQKDSKYPLLGLLILEGSTETGTDALNSKKADLFAAITINSKLDVMKQDYTTNPSIDAGQFKRTRKLKKDPISSEIIDTDDDIAASTGDNPDYQDLGPNFERLSLNQLWTETPRISTIDLGSVYEEAFVETGPRFRTGEPDNNMAFVDVYIARLQTAFRALEERPCSGFLNLLQLSNPIYLFDDLSSLFGNIQTLVESDLSELQLINFRFSVTESTSSLAIHELPEDLPNQTNNMSQTDAARGLEVLAKSWLDSLPVDSSTKTRLRRDRIARMVCVDFYLSSLGIYPKIVPKDGPSQSSRSPGSFLQSQYTDESIDGPRRDVGITSSPNVESTPSSDRMSVIFPRLFLENFTPVTHTSPGSSDLVAILSDWRVDESPEVYMWQPLESIQQTANENMQNVRSRSRSRAGSSRRRALSEVGSDKIHSSTGSDRLPMTQPNAAAQSSQASSSQRFPASQIQRGKYGDSRKTKKRRTEGF